jgi:very-short-patch-repair endonuclease
MDVAHDMDRRLAEVADDQWGVVRRSDLEAIGLSRTMIADRIAKGRLRVLYRGVYAVGHRRLRREGEWLAAAWGAGPTAVISHWTAAAQWDLLAPRGRRIHVTRPSSSGREPNPARIRVHRVATLRPWECTTVDTIPITTAARTVLDLASQMRPAALEDLIARADRLALFDLVAVRRSLLAHPRQRGAPALRRLLDELYGSGAADLRSGLEVKLLQLCADHGLPRPAANVQIAGFLVDFHWPGTSLVVETDGYAFHSTRAAFERDRDRDQLLALAGYRVLRFTYVQVTQTPEAVAHRIRRLLV